MASKHEANREVKNLEDALKNYGSIVWRRKGRSMHPFFDSRRDLVVLEDIATGRVVVAPITGRICKRVPRRNPK